MNTSTLVNMRIDSHRKQLIDTAVQILSTDRTHFMVEAAYERAKEVILEECCFSLEPNTFDAFEQSLQTQPMGENTCLMALLNRPHRWD